MWLNDTKSWLAAGLLVLMVGAPVFAGDIDDFQGFAPPDLTPYGDGIQPREGFFFVFDGLMWSISTPRKTTIGFPNLTRNVFYGPAETDMRVEGNTMDTGPFSADFVGGNRFDVGRVEGRHGWFVSVYRLNVQTQFITKSDVHMVFFDPEFGPQGTKLLEGLVQQAPDVIRDLPLQFGEVTAANRTKLWSVEWNCLYRQSPCYHRGIFEWFAGVRYLELTDRFTVTTQPRVVPTGETAPTVPDVLGECYWNTEAQNHIIGPQVGVRWFRQWDRITLSTEGRFFAGVNLQNLNQDGTLGEGLNPPGTLFRPRLMPATSFTNEVHEEEFSPLVELRANFDYQITRAVSVRVGWTGTWMDGMARASDIIHYEVPTMGIEMANNRQRVFVHGVTVGVNINR